MLIRAQKINFVEQNWQSLTVRSYLTNWEDHTHSKFVSFGKIKAIKQSDGLGVMESMEHASIEWGRMKRSLAHMDLVAGILITPAHTLCFKYDTKS